MTQLLENAYDPELFRQQGHALVDQLADYLKRCQQKTALKVLPWLSPDEMLGKWQSDFSTPTPNDIQDFFAGVIADSIHIHHPYYMGHQVVPPAPLAALTDLAGAILNNSTAIYEMGPLSAAMEKIVLKWLSTALGMNKEASGVLTSGGSSGNLTSLLAARQNQTNYNIWEEGNNETHNLAVMVSAEAHYSISRAVKIMGWGEKSVIKLPLNQRKEVDSRMLEHCYNEAVAEGKQVIALVGNACSTSTGSYDPLEEMAAFCQEKKLWFHVDGAHGAGAILSGKYRHLVKGIEKADSIVIDFHKMLLCPALTTAVIFKNEEFAQEIFAQKASYLLDSDKKGHWFDIAARTLECTKKMISVKIYALLRTYGRQLFADYITKTYDLAQDFATIIQDSPDFELALQPASNIVCFRYAPGKYNPGQFNDLNSRIRNHIKEDGQFYIVQTLIDGDVYLRTTLMNPFTSTDDCKQLLEKIRESD